MLTFFSFANLWSHGQADSLFPEDIARIESTQIHSRPHGMGMHSWMGNEMESLWSVISYLGSRIVPGSLVQTISSIIAVKKKSISWIFFGLSWMAFLFSWWWKISNAELIELSSGLWDVRLRKTCSFNNSILGKSNEAWSLLLWYLFQLSIAVWQHSFYFFHSSVAWLCSAKDSSGSPPSGH